MENIGGWRINKLTNPWYSRDMLYEKFFQKGHKGGLDEEKSKAEKIDLEAARQSWQRIHEIMCSGKPELKETDIGEVIDHLAICISFLDDVEGGGGGETPESIRDEITQGVFTREFEEFIATRDELFDSEISPPNDRMLCDLCVSPRVKIRFTFIKTTGREEFITLDYDTELIHPYQGFYRGAWEQMQEKFASLPLR